MTLIQPDNRPIGRYTYVLCEAWNNSGVTVPGGFINDGGSVPRFAWSLTGLTPDGPGRAAWVMHDYLYRFSIGARLEADREMRRLLRAAGVNAVQAGIAYAAVRVGGARHFGRAVPPKHDKPDELIEEIIDLHEAGVLDSLSAAFAFEMISKF